MADTTTTTDPVCGMPVLNSPQTARITYGGKEYLFCSATCRHRFEVDPHPYIPDIGTSSA